MTHIKTFMDALKTGRPFTDEERKELHDILQHIDNTDTISIPTSNGTIHAYANRVKDYPTMNITWQPKDIDAEIDLVAITRDLSDDKLQNLKLFMWGDLSTDDITESKIMNTNDIVTIIKNNNKGEQ